MARPIVRTAIVLGVLATAAAAAGDDASPRRSIAVTGEGEVKVAPDRAVLSFAVETTAPAAAAAVSENAHKSTALADVLKRQVGNTGKVYTTRYSVDPVYDQRERGAPAAPPRITGYVARNQVRAETSAIDSVGALIDAATKAGANQIDGLDFTLEERAQAQTDALRRAGEDARRQADATAAALGLKLGQVLTATTGSVPIIAPRARMMGVAMAEMSAKTPIDAGDVTVSATLQVTYEIE